MITYQDFLAVEQTDKSRAEFVRKVIDDYKSSDIYRNAAVADDYCRGRNTTTMQYQKTITTVTGEVVPDKYSAVHRSTSNFFNVFTTQLNQYLLGNGAKWGNDSTSEKLGNDLDTRLQQVGKAALVGGVSYGFFNLDPRGLKHGKQQLVAAVQGERRSVEEGRVERVQLFFVFLFVFGLVPYDFPA